MIGTIRYGRHKERALREAVGSADMLERFRTGGALPEGFGWGLDERIVEYPWVFSRLPQGPAHLLDAGSTFNYAWIAEQPVVREKSVVLYTLAPEGTLACPNYSYLYGDLRDTMLRDQSFDVIACISTLEHVGMDNTWFYTGDRSFEERRSDTRLEAVREFHRLLKPGGRLLLTVPFGEPQDLGWLQQFDSDALDRVVEAFQGECRSRDFYRYTGDGWRRAEERECSDSEFVFVPASDDPARGGAASAGAVALLELVR